MSDFVEKTQNLSKNVEAAAQADGATEIFAAQEQASMGSAKSVLAVAEKDFFTPDEVDSLTERELSDPEILKTVINSMKKWR